MKDEYDFSEGTRGPFLSNKGKTRITIFLDDAILEAFRAQALEQGTGYQTLINNALKEYLAQDVKKPVTEEALRRILQEELPTITRQPVTFTTP